MNFKELSSSEVFGIFLGLFIFLFLSFVVAFKSEWLDSFFNRQVEDGQELLVEGEVLEFVEVLPYASLRMNGSGGKASLFIDLEEEATISGLELFLRKDTSLVDLRFDCNEPFECAYVDIGEEEVVVLAVIPPNSVEVIPSGELLVGEFTYSGLGKLSLDGSEKTFLSTIDDAVVNILKDDVVEFVLR
jgi:hypothetical protein